MDFVEFLNETVFCELRPSLIQGVGVFAVRDIPIGKKINKSFGFIEMSSEDFKKLLPEVQNVILRKTVFIEGKPIIFLHPNSHQIIGYFINHSIDPNSDGESIIKPVLTGEEITKDYSKITGKLNVINDPDLVICIQTNLFCQKERE